MGSYLTSLRKLSTLPINLALPGHNEPISNLPARCEQIMSHQLQRRDRLEALLDDQPRTAYELGVLVSPAAAATGAASPPTSAATPSAPWRRTSRAWSARNWPSGSKMTRWCGTGGRGDKAACADVRGGQRSYSPPRN